MDLQIGDRVSEKGRKGTVVAFHTEGTVDVHFDDMEHEIRRQIRQVKPIRKNGKVTPIPLIIACSNAKNRGTMPAYELYNGSLWTSFRKHAPTPPDRDIPIYVLSAKYGIIPYDEVISDYDLQIVGNNKRFYRKNEIKASDVAKKIGQQWNAGQILLAGGQHYESALNQAGFEVQLVENIPAFPYHRAKDRGIGLKRQALNWLLGTYLPSFRR